MEPTDLILKQLEQAVAWMGKHDERLMKIDRCLIKQEANLCEHMRRTELAELEIAKLKTELKPVKLHINHMEGALKLLGVIALLVTVISALVGLFRY